LPAVEAVQGVREQTRAAMIEGRRVPARAEKQRMLEALAYQTVTLIRVRESAQEGGNEAFLAELSDSAQATMQRQDLDLRAMALTEDGLVRR
jgi:flagellum-specific peptidoglycan hydrolase FlgJ